MDGLFVRGAICIGDLFVREKPRSRAMVFGPGLVKAYELEHTVAVFPRVILDDEVAGALAQPHSYVGRGDDGVYFMDYLYGHLLDMYCTPPQNFPSTYSAKYPAESLRQHGARIREQLQGERADSDVRIRQKHVWLGLYHNRTVERLKEFCSRNNQDPAFFADCAIDTKYLV
jgi:hypothetical protein